MTAPYKRPAPTSMPGSLERKDGRPVVALERFRRPRSWAYLARWALVRAFVMSVVTLLVYAGGESTYVDWQTTAALWAAFTAIHVGREFEGRE